MPLLQVDPVSAATWIPAFIQGGAFCVVAFVVFFLLKYHLPQTTKEFREAIAMHIGNFTKSLSEQEASGKAVLTEFLQTMRHQADLFREELHAERQDNKDNLAKILAAIDRQNALLLFLISRLTQGNISPQELDQLASSGKA